MSEKVCAVADVFLIGKFIGGEVLASLNLITPLMFFTGIFYILFGQGGSLFALRAKSDRDEEKSNLYFTISVFGIIIVSLILNITLKYLK